MVKQKLSTTTGRGTLRKQKVDRMLMLGDPGIKILDENEVEISFFPWNEIKKFKSSIQLGEWSFQVIDKTTNLPVDHIFKSMQVSYFASILI